MDNTTLIINSGSSSLKFKLFNRHFKVIVEGLIEKIGLSNSFIDFQIGKKKNKIFKRVKNHEDAMSLLIQTLTDEGVNFNLIYKVGHRVVHGAEKFIKPTLITEKVLVELEKINELAPLHNPNNIAGIKACKQLMPWTKNYAVFDTAFHNSLPAYASLYPLPYRLYEKQAIRRYGFHGISHQYVTIEVAKKLKKTKLNIISCHLGSGCSVCAIKNGQSVDTSMGFTPLEGLMMASRSGDIDPAIIFYLNRQGMSIDKIDKLLNFESGLVGVSGLQDMRDIMIASGYKIDGYDCMTKFTKEQKYLSKLALQMFVYRIKKYIGAYTAILGKVDVLVFTAGIGERNSDIRELILKGLPHKPKVLIIPANEELMIAKLI